MKNKIKNILIFIMGGIVFSIIGVIGSNVITATQVGINSSKTDKTNIQDAIDELYTKASKKNIIYGKSSTASGKTVVTNNLPTGVKAIIYLDPTDLSKSCTASNSVSTTGTKTGCMKWYAYLEDDNSYTMILDHNSTANSYYNYDNTNTSLGIRSASELTIETGTTINHNEIGYDLQQLTGTSGWKVTPRLISAIEIANIVGKTTWSVGDSAYSLYPNCSTIGVCSAGTNKYAWLFDYTINCISHGCNIEDNSMYGYWTSTPIYNSSSSVYDIRDFGFLNSDSSSSAFVGLRPVITILK